MLKLMFVGIGGAMGAVLRYELDALIIKDGFTDFPWGTLTVNLIGCFIIGVAYKIFEEELLHHHFQSFSVTGFLGALTTFSSYSYATLMLFEQGRVYLAFTNLLLNNVLGILFAFIGAKITSRLVVIYLKE